MPLTVIAYAGLGVCIILLVKYFKRVSNPKHDVGIKLEGRTPPDPELFPNKWQNRQGLWLNYREWWPSHEMPIKAVIFLLHGYGDATHRYEHICRMLTLHGYAVFGLDQQGHGCSEGDRSYVEKMEHFVTDFSDFIQLIHSQYSPNASPSVTNLPPHPNHLAVSTLPHFLLAHSMGGLIGSLFLLDHPNRNPSDNSHCGSADSKKLSRLFKGVVLSGPALGVGAMQTNTTLVLCRIASALVPKLHIESDNPRNRICRHPQFINRLTCDSCTSGNAPVRTGAEILKHSMRIMDMAKDLTIPTLILFGGNDMVCSLEMSKIFFENVSAKDKTFSVHDHMEHELFQDYEWRKVSTEVCAWFDARC